MPAGFVGVMADGPLFDPQVSLDSEVGAMREAGVESVRFAIYWNEAQPFATASEVPPGEAGRFTDADGVPTDFGAIDRFVAATAARGLRLLPVVLRAPRWARTDPDRPASPPSAAGIDAYARFLAALARRYGPGGSFWVANPGLPDLAIRQWQIWNEPAGQRDWDGPGGLQTYVDLLRPAYRAIKTVDPRADVLLAGLVGRSWKQLAAIYRYGGGGSFDVVAIHPFTRRLVNVMTLLRRARAVMRRRGDARMPLVVTELSWPSAKYKTTQTYGFETTEHGQARRLRAALLEIAANRRRLRIPAVYWSTWISYDRDPVFSFDYAGLRRLEGGRVVAKPAYFAFRRVARELER